MKRRKKSRHHVKRHRASRRHYKRNPSFGGGKSGFMSTVMSGAVAGVGGILVLKVSDMIATMAGKQADPKFKNIVRLALTLGSGFLLPKYVKNQYAKSLVDGMATVTTMAVLNTSFGMNLSLAGDDSARLDEIVRNLDISGVAEINGDYSHSMLGYESSDAELLGIAEMHGDDVEQFL